MHDHDEHAARDRPRAPGTERVAALVPPVPARPELPARLRTGDRWTHEGARSLVALQRTAGNRAVARLLGGDRADMSVQRCGEPGCTDCGPGQQEAPAQGIEGQQEEEYPAPGQSAVRQAGPAGSRRPVVQRVATFTAGPVHQVNNLADVVVNGTPAGVTWPTLNGTQFWSTAAARAALNRPTVTTTAVAAGGFDAQAATVLTNTGSFDETVLARGPWRHVTTKATIGAMLPTLGTCTGGDNTRFRAYGKPSDQAMFAANRRHEDRHARDHRAAFNATIKPWDDKLTAAKNAGQRFHGATAAAAEAALWAAMGGTPDQIADAFMNQCAAAVVAYHSTAAGGPIGPPTNPGARNSCAISWAKYRNPS